MNSNFGTINLDNGVHSTKRRWLHMICLNLSLLCQVLSVGFGKKAALSMFRFYPQSALESRYYLLSILSLALQSVFWPIALLRYPLTFSYFYMSASYAAILVMSWMVFNEPMSIFNIIGAMLIVTGVNLMVGGEGCKCNA